METKTVPCAVPAGLSLRSMVAFVEAGMCDAGDTLGGDGSQTTEHSILLRAQHLVLLQVCKNVHGAQESRRHKPDTISAACTTT